MTDALDNSLDSRIADHGFDPPRDSKGKLGAMDWTDHETKLLRALRSQGLTFEQISKHIHGRTRAACKCYWRTLNMPDWALQQIKSRKNARQRLQYRDEWIPERLRFSVEVPPEVWKERDVSLNEPRPLSAWLFGDPPPSRSALRQRVA